MALDYEKLKRWLDDGPRLRIVKVEKFDASNALVDLWFRLEEKSIHSVDTWITLEGRCRFSTLDEAVKAKKRREYDFEIKTVETIVD